MDDEEKKYDIEWIYALYEEGKPIAEIAAELGKEENYVYTLMRKKPERYEDVKRIREEKYNLKIRRIRGLADHIMLEYLEELAARLRDKNTTDEEKEDVFVEIEKVQKIAKLYSDRVLQTEGKTDKNSSIKGDRPIEVIIRKAYEEEDETETND